MLAVLVSVQTPAGQLLKLPLLIEHFVKHQKQSGTSLIDFLENHYAKDHKDADFPEDEQLPFKNISFYSIGHAVVPSVVQTNVRVPLPADKNVIFSEEYALQQNLRSIFHPPRV